MDPHWDSREVHSFNFRADFYQSTFLCQTILAFDCVANEWHCGYDFIAAIIGCSLQVRNWTTWSKIWMK